MLLQSPNGLRHAPFSFNFIASCPCFPIRNILSSAFCWFTPSHPHFWLKCQRPSLNSTKVVFLSVSLFIIFKWGCGLNSGLHVCHTGALPPSHKQPSHKPSSHSLVKLFVLITTWKYIFVHCLLSVSSYYKFKDI
jgi:hypothetical protein